MYWPSLRRSASAPFARQRYEKPLQPLDVFTRKRVSTGRRVAGLPTVVSIANSFTMIVPTGAAHAPLPLAVIACPFGNPIQRRFFVPSDHSSLTMSYGTSPACGVVPLKQPVAETVAGG